MPRKVTPRLNTYSILSRAVETGIQWGLSRADKHADDPLTEAQRTRLTDHLDREIMNALSEVVRFEDG